MNDKVKVRFAPSPTGPLHIGGARSALFNYLYAAHYGGTMVVRSEDTDLERSCRKYEQEIIESLQWLGIEWQEGLGTGGEAAPYRQTERLDIYNEYLKKLIDDGNAYHCFCSTKDLEQERKELIEHGETPRYLGRCRNLSSEEKDARLAAGIKPTIRFKVQEKQVYVLHDLVRGTVTFNSDNIGDFIIAKSDGIPTYNFAVVLDDVLMGITHVIRAEEHLTNTPRQLMLYDALNFKRPQFAHISLIMGSDHQKMSKRHGATSVVQYREMGYLPEAMFNFLALLGWSPEGEEEILSADHIKATFTMERVAKAPAVFDLNKLNWMNQQYIMRLELEDLLDRLGPFVDKSAYRPFVQKLAPDQLLILALAVKERLVCLTDIYTQLELVFGPVVYEDEALLVLGQKSVWPVLDAFLDGLPVDSDPELIKKYLKQLTKELKLKARDVFMPIRCALSGKVHGPDLNYLIALWGREETIRRIKASREIDVNIGIK